MVLEALSKASGEKNPNLEFTDNLSFGDFRSNVAMIRAKEENKNPKKLAEEIVSKLQINQSTNQLFDRVEVAGPGFINFWLKKDVLLSNLMQIDAEKEKYGTSNIGKGKTVVIDYSSPNIAKPFGIGHLRSTVIGQALYNLYASLGYKVIGDNHLGDWGTQFGVLLRQISKISNAKSRMSNLTIENLEKLYVEFHKEAEENPEIQNEAKAWFKKLEDGDSEAKAIWEKCVEVSMAEFNKIYDLLGVKIDYTYGESYYENIMSGMLTDPKITKFLSPGDDGKSKVVNLEEFGIATPLMFLKSDGATTYATRDMATIRFRMEKWNPVKIIYEVGAEQALHFKQLFAAAKLTGLVGDRVELIHTAHGLYLAPDGRKFSTREGKTIKLEEVLTEAVSRAKKLGNSDSKTAEEVGVGAIKYFDLMHSVGSSVVFDWDKIMNMEGNSGPYLQYTVARTNSVLAKSVNLQISKSANKLEIGKWKMENEELTVLRALSRFSGIIVDAAKSYSPNLLCNYLYDLAQKYNGFYNAHKIIGGENEEFKLALTKGTGQVLKNGLSLLGIQTPERM